MNKAPASTFFPEIKREVALDNWAPKFNTENEKRFRLDISIPLTGHALVGMPSFIGDAFEALAQEDSAVDTMTLSPEVEGVTFEFFATPTTPRTMLITAATLRSLELVAKGEENTRTVSLCFNTTIPANHKLLNWLYENHGSTMWCKFTETQGTLVGAESAQMKLSEQPLSDNERLTDDELEAIGEGYQEENMQHVCDDDDPEGCTGDDHEAAMRARAKAGRAKADKASKAKTMRQPRGFSKPTNASAVR